MSKTMTVRRDKVVPGMVFTSSHGAKLLVCDVRDDAEVRSDERHVEIRGFLHCNTEREVAAERYPAGSTVEVELFDPNLLPKEYAVYRKDDRLCRQVLSETSFPTYREAADEVSEFFSWSYATVRAYRKVR